MYRPRCSNLKVDNRKREAEANMGKEIRPGESSCLPGDVPARSVGANANANASLDAAYLSGTQMHRLVLDHVQST